MLGNTGCTSHVFFTFIWSYKPLFQSTEATYFHFFSLCHIFLCTLHYFGMGRQSLMYEIAMSRRPYTTLHNSNNESLLPPKIPGGGGRLPMLTVCKMTESLQCGYVLYYFCLLKARSPTLHSQWTAACDTTSSCSPASLDGPRRQ